MDTGLSSTSGSYIDNLNPFGSQQPDDTRLAHLTTQDSSCQMGSEIVLKRIVKKLFHQVNRLQPSELDDEIIFQAPLTYDDYLSLMKFSNEEQQLNCASLNNLENVLSNFISKAQIERPAQAGNAFTSFSSSLNLFPNLPHANHANLNLHLLTVLFIVGLLAWFFRNVAGMKSSWKSLPLSFVLVGFVEYCMHKNELSLDRRVNLERCKNPSYVARLASLINYDWDSCHSSGVTRTNIALNGVEYLSELIFQPLVQFWAKFGAALEGYLNSFSGFNYMIAPLFPILMIVASVVFGIPLVSFILNRRAPTRQPRQQQSPNKAIAMTPKKMKNKSNAIK